MENVSLTVYQTLNQRVIKPICQSTINLTSGQLGTERHFIHQMRESKRSQECTAHHFRFPSNVPPPTALVWSQTQNSSWVNCINIKLTGSSSTLFTTDTKRHIRQRSITCRRALRSLFVSLSLLWRHPLRALCLASDDATKLQTVTDSTQTKSLVRPRAAGGSEHIRVLQWNWARTKLDIVFALYWWPGGWWSGGW